MKHNAQSAAWQEFILLAGGPAENKSGITFVGSNSPDELDFAKFEYKLKLRREKDGLCISGSIVNDRIPAGKLPKARRF
jgi:hypothetical protein